MKKYLENDFFLSSLSKISNIAFGFLSLILLNRFLGTSLKGEYSSILNIITILSSIFQLGICSVYSRFKRRKINNCYEIFISLSIYQLIIYVIISLIILFLTHINLKVFTILVITIISIFTTQLRYINLVENIKYNTLVVLIMSFINFLCTLLAFLLLNRSVAIAFIIYVIKDVTIILMYVFKHMFKKEKIKIFSKKYFYYYKNIIKEGILPMLSSLLIILNYKIDIIMLNQFNVDFSLIGIYSLGLSIAEYLWIIPDIFKDVVQKRTAKDNSIDTVNFSLRISSTFIILSYILLIIMGKSLFSIIFGSEFENSYFITLILFFGVYSIVYYKIIGQLLIADNKSKEYFIILLFGVIINFICNILSIPKFNIYGAALSSIVSYSVIGVVFLMFYLKKYKVKLNSILFIKKSDLKKVKKFVLSN